MTSGIKLVIYAALNFFVLAAVSIQRNYGQITISILIELKLLKIFRFGTVIGYMCVVSCQYLTGTTDKVYSYVIDKVHVHLTRVIGCTRGG